MRILYLTSQYPFPPRGGGALRAYGLMKEVRQTGHTLDLFSFVPVPPATDDEMHTLCDNILTRPAPERRLADRLRDLLLSTKADMARRFWSDEALTQILAHITKHPPAVIHAESIEMAAYLPAIHAKHPEIPLIYGSLNAEADLQRTMFSIDRRHPQRIIGTIYSWIQWRRLTQLEQHLCDISAYVLAVSELDKEILGKLSSTPIQIVKNGIHTDLYTDAPDSGDFLSEKAIVFTGTMDYRPNVDAMLWFAGHIFPQILTTHPDSHLYIVGHRPHSRLEPLHARQHITITGKVPEIQPYLQGAEVYIAPLRMGSGTRFKILEAMATGCAVVSTTLGAQGLGVTSGQELLLADKEQSFAEAVNTLLNNPEKRQQIAALAQTFVRENFDWSVIVPHLLAVYDKLAN